MADVIRVLLVDDDPLVRSALSLMLGGQADIEVVGEAPNGEAGVALVSEKQPDVVLMDIRMPVMDGLEATEVLHSRPSPPAVVVLTSGLKVFSAGADATWMAGEVQRDGMDALVETFVRTMDRFRALSLRLRQSPLLVVAALNGHTLAGGLELAAACDLGFCADDERLRIGVPEMDLFGAMPSGGAWCSAR